MGLRVLVPSGRAVDGSAVAPSHLEGPMPPTCIQTMQAVCSCAARRREKLYVSSLLRQGAPANFDRHIRYKRIICLMTLVCRQPTLAAVHSSALKSTHYMGVSCFFTVRSYAHVLIAAYVNGCLITSYTLPIQRYAVYSFLLNSDRQHKDQRKPKQCKLHPAPSSLGIA